MADFPTLGLRFDLSGIIAGESGLDRLERAYVAVGMSMDEAKAKAIEANAAIGKSIAGTTEAQVIGSSAAKRAADAEAAILAGRIKRYEDLAKVARGQVAGADTAAAQAANDKLLEIDRALIASRLGLRRQEAKGMSDIDAQTLAFRIRMTAQQTAEANRAAAAEVAAQAAAAKEIESQRLYLQGVKMRSFAMEEQAATQSAAATAAADAAAARDAERTRLYLQGVKIRSLAAEEQAATQAAAAVAAAEAAAARDAEKAFTYTHGLKLRYLADEEKAAIASSARLRAQADADNKFLTALQNRVTVQTKTSDAQRALFTAQAAARGLSAEAAPLISNMKKIEDSLGHVSGQALKVREAFVLIREFMRGDFTRMAGSASILAGAFGALAPAVLPFTLALLALAGVAAVVIGAMVKMELEADHLANALLVTNNAVGLTAGQIEDMGKRIADATGTSVSSAVKVLTQLTASGEVSAQSLETVADAAVRLSKFTGEASGKIANELVKGFDDATKAAVALNNQYHFLTPAQYEQIDLAQRSGDKQKAFNLLMADFDGYLKNITPQMGFFARTWEHLANAIDGAARALGNYGKQKTNDEALDKAKKDLAAYEKNPALAQTVYASRVADLRREIAGRQIVQMSDQADARRAGATAKTNTEAVATDDYLKNTLPKLGGSDTRGEEEVNNFIAMVNRGDPNSAYVKDARAHMAQYIAAIKKKYNRAAYRPSGTTGVQNQVQAAIAEIAGLNSQIDNASADPLSQFTSQINKAYDVARAKDSVGKRSGFANQQAQLAGLKEEATLRLQLTNSLVQQDRAAQQKLKTDQLAKAGNDEAFASMKAFYETGVTDTNAYIDALERVDAIQLKAKQSQNDYAIAKDFGVDHVNQIADAYYKAVISSKAYTNATAEQKAEVRADADALQAKAQKTLDDANATDASTAAEKRLEDQRARLTAASKAYLDMVKQVGQAEKDANLSPIERAAAAKTAVIAEQLLAKAKLDNVHLTDDQANAEARVLAVILQQRDETAKLKTDLQEQMRQTFIDTGKLDFDGLRQGVTKALRKSIYDALIAKPIDIVVNAVVDVATKGLESLLNNVLSGGDSGGGGLLSSIMGFLKGGSRAPGTSSDISSFASEFASAGGSLDKAAATISHIPSLLTGLGNVFAGAMIGPAGASSIFGKPKNATGALIGGGLGGLAGGALGAAVGAGYSLAGFATVGAALGPIGLVVGAILGAALGGLIGGKESNHGAIATITGSSYAISGDKRNDDTTKLATAAAEAVIASVQTLKDAGITLNDTISKIDIGTRDPATIYLGSGSVLHSDKIGDAAAAADVALKALLQGATYINDAEKKLVDSMLAAGSSFDDIAIKLKAFADAQTFYNSVDRSIQKLKDPQGAALADLQDTQIARRKQAISYFQQGLLTGDQLKTLNDKFSQLEKLEIVDTLSQFQSAVADSTISLQDWTDAQSKITDYLNSLKISALSPLSPQAQLTEAGNQFMQMLQLAKGGDKTALGNITGSANDYLTKAQDFYGSTSSYGSIYATVTAALSQLSTSAYPISSTGTGTVTTDTQAVIDAVAALQKAILDSGADLLTAVDPATNDNATGVDISTQTTALLGGLGGIQQTLGQVAEAITGTQMLTTAQVVAAMQASGQTLGVLTGGGSVMPNTQAA